MKLSVPSVVFVFLLLLTAAGCGDDGPKIVRVAGKATYQQKPVSNLILTFSPTSGRPSIGVTDAEGQFDLDFDENRKGAQVGVHKVTVEYRPKDPGEEMDILEGKKKRPKEIAAIIKKYNEGSQSLNVEIKEATTELELKLD
jgi:hypothetical protein